MSQVNIQLNYLTNVDEVIKLADEHAEQFSIRSANKTDDFTTAYGSSSLKSLYSAFMSQELKDAIFKTIPDDIRFVDSFTINRYDPGDYLKRHRDSAGGYWKFKLIFLQSGAPHFQWFDENGEGHLITEEPGSLLDMPINLEHEVTQIGENEKSKYSLVLAWGRMD